MFNQAPRPRGRAKGNQWLQREEEPVLFKAEAHELIKTTLSSGQPCTHEHKQQ